MAPASRRSIANKKNFCKQCKLEVKDSEESIECDKCNKLFHVMCTALDKVQFNHLCENENEEFLCQFCNKNNNNNNSHVTSELNVIKTELKKLDQLSSMHETITFMSKQYDSILKGLAENKKQLEIIQKENKELKEEVNMLKDSVKMLNQQRVQNDCVITGVKTNENLSAVDTVVKLSADVGVVVKPDDAFFLNNKNGKSRSIVIKFNSKKSKAELMSIKQKLKGKDETKNIYVHDYLCRETMSLLNYAKSLKSVGFRAVYAHAGKVFVKRSELSQPRLIKSEKDVDKILSEATTYKPQLKQARQVPQIDLDSDNDYKSTS